MRKIRSFNYNRLFVIAQAKTDAMQEPIDTTSLDNPYDPQTMDEQLPVIRQQDLAKILEDDQENELATPLGPPPGQPMKVEKPEDVESPEVAPPIESEPEIQPKPQKKPKEKEIPEFGNNVPAAVRWAEKNNEVIRIFYRTRKGNHIERIVEPHGRFVSESTGNTIVVCYDRSVRDIRAFILSQIEDFLFVDRKFKPKMRIVP